MEDCPSPALTLTSGLISRTLLAIAEEMALERRFSEASLVESEAFRSFSASDLLTPTPVIPGA